MRAVVFDLGNTLKNYEAFPLNWQGFYRDAIVSLLQSINVGVTPERIETGASIFLKYNTRVNPREYEVDASTIFSELFREWGVTDFSKMETAEDAFAFFFTRQSELYPETVKVLQALKRRDFRVGVLTNVAYGMAGERLFRDIAEITQYIDVFLPSTEAGFRKPHPKGYLELGRRLSVDVSECIFIGDENVDIIGANRVGMVSVLIDRHHHHKAYGQKHTVSSLEEILVLV